jgi:phosphatidylglycerophosphatase A
MPGARRLFAAHPIAALLATGFGAGLSPIAPGTAGSAVGLALAWLLVPVFPFTHPGSLLPVAGLLMSGLAVGLLGVAVSGPVCRVLESSDPGCVVIDEVAGQLIASAAVPWLAPFQSTAGEAAAWVASFVLFRAFDVVKPWPIGRLQCLPGGWGVVADDVAAGIAAAAVLALVVSVAR